MSSDLSTLNHIVFHALETHDKPSAFRYKVEGRFTDVSSADYLGRMREVSLGLISLGLERGDRVALISPTRFEWILCDTAILTAALVSVPVYPTLPAAAVEYILENAEARCVIVADAEQAAKVAPFVAARPEVRVISLEGGVEGTLSLADLRLRGVDLARAEPSLHRTRADEVSPDDLATLIYTSGTTGVPKGVMLTHGNIASNVVTAVPLLTFYPSDTSLCFLPMSHILERMVEYAFFHAGATLAFAGSVESVPADLVEVRPTLLVSVPRLFEKMYARVLEAASQGSAVKRSLFAWACGVGDRAVAVTQAGGTVGGLLAVQLKLANTLVFRKLAARLGGRMRVMVSGGAPLTPEIARFFAAAGLPIYEGYGLTETSPVIAVNCPDHHRIGSVGKIIDGVEVKIAEDGEILTRGPNVMPGYYKLPQETAEALQGGWLHTGDIGRLDEDGYLFITDRKKDLLVTAGGKNVAPQPIENTLKTDPYIAEAVVVGDRRPFLAALIVPEFDALRDLAHSGGLDPEDHAAMAADPRVREFLQERVDGYMKDAAPFETVRRIGVLAEEFTIAGGELTPTMKVKRKVINERYAEVIDAVYAETSTDV